ncbi:membrane protein [Nocardia nova]|nr:membrane protein [Nocardia nova]PPJ06234.1 membrane protein [Nocardia nova]
MRPPTGLPSLSRRSRILLITALVIAALLLVGPRLTDAYTNWLWFGEVGFRQVFTTVLVTRLLLFLIVAIVVGALVWLALLAAYRTRPVFVPVSGPSDPIARYRTTVMGRLRLFGIGIPVLVGLLSGLVAQSSWVTVQLFLHGGSFGIKDPQFNIDVGFYAFDLPFYKLLLNWLFVAVVIAFFANLVTHYIFGGLRLSGREGTLTRPARIQLALIAGTFVVLKAVAYWFDRYSLLSSTRKEPTFTGGSYTDINAVLPAKLILMSIAIICAVAFFAGVVLRDLRVPAMAAALLLLSSILVGAVWPLVVEQFEVRPNAATKEATYIERNITATRQAYGLTDDKVSYVDYKGSQTKDPGSIPADQQTIGNIRLLDPNLLTQTFIQRQQLQNFYGFPDPLDIDRYTINGEKQDYIVAARELVPQNLSGNQTDWINKHTVYTHGDGFVASPANRVNVAPPKETQQAATGAGTSSSSGGYGYPVFNVGDKSTVSDLFTPKDRQAIPVDQPRIYYGEMISKSDADYAIVGGNNQPPREYDTGTEQYTYTGQGGVPIGNWFNRLAFAAKYAERNILFSGAIGSDSKIIYNRDPRSRVQQVAPWLTTDGDMYPAVVNGRILWIVDAYTTLDNFPYAQRTSLEGVTEDSIDQNTGRTLPRKEVSYIRNSVKATVDAYDGTVNLYDVDPTDPVLNAWRGVFPNSVKPQSEISPELRAHFRYPEDLFKVQREMLARYHVNDPREFFTNNAFWSVPNDPTSDTPTNAHQPPYYVLIGDPKTGRPQFNLTSAMVGFKRQFLAAYIQVASDPENYGKFTVLKLPTDSQTPGPQQVQTSMTTDARVSNDRTLLTGGNTNKIKYGNLLTLPIGEGGILYVEPWYLERNSGPTTASFPQLVKVLASYGDKVGYQSTLGDALNDVQDGLGAATTQQPGQAAINPPGQQGSTSPPPSNQNTPPPSTTAPPPTTGSAGKDAAVKELNDALKGVEDAQKSGDLGQLGKALEGLQKAIDDYNKAGG